MLNCNIEDLLVDVNFGEGIGVVKGVVVVHGVYVKVNMSTLETPALIYRLHRLVEISGAYFGNMIYTIPSTKRHPLWA
jgi:hypothetical protein